MKSKSCWLNVECSSVTHFTTSFLFSGQDPGRNPPLRRLVRIDTILSRASFPEQPMRRARELDQGAVIQPTTSRKNWIGVGRPWLERVPRRALDAARPVDYRRLSRRAIPDLNASRRGDDAVVQSVHHQRRNRDAHCDGVVPTKAWHNGVPAQAARLRTPRCPNRVTGS